MMFFNIVFLSFCRLLLHIEDRGETRLDTAYQEAGEVCVHHGEHPTYDALIHR